MATKQATDVRDEILAHLEEIRRPLAWISDKEKNTDIPYASIYSMFVQRTYGVSQENLNKINKFLETEFTLPE